MTGGAYDRAVVQAIAVAESAIDARLSTLYNATATSEHAEPVPLVVFDVDDTLLSTHAGRRRQFAAYMAVQGADLPDDHLPPIGPVVRLHQRLVERGVRTAIVTGRWSTERDATLANLCRVGVDRWDHALFRAAGTPDALLPAADYKRRQRARLTAAGYTIVANIGDQRSDLGDNDPGVVNVQLPNPMYTVY